MIEEIAHAQFPSVYTAEGLMMRAFRNREDADFCRKTSPEVVRMVSVPGGRFDLVDERSGPLP